MRALIRWKDGGPKGMSRYGQALLWAGGLAIAALMAYTIALDTGSSRALLSRLGGEGTAEVAVFYPERVLWNEFRLAVGLCARKGLAKVVEESDNAVTVSTPRHGRLVRFALDDVRGLRETKDEITRALERHPEPVAVVGSSNTVLTLAIAEALRANAGRDGGKGPVLLIPWASAVLAERPEPGEGPTNLLDILPGRTFRFCPNNQHQADLIVQCLADRDHEAGKIPRRVVLVVDRRDPYSVDLAAGFHRAIEAVAPEAEIVERADSLGLPLLHDPTMLPGPEEDALADSIWQYAEKLPRGQTTWVVLPLQSEPTQRMITALRRHARRGLRSEESPIRVVCGDGIGFSVLASLAGRCAFPIWCGSSASVPAAAQALGEGLSPDTQIAAEIVSTLVRCLDLPGGQPPTSNRLRDALAALKIDANDPAAMGRSLAFSRSGERVGNDLGHLLMIQPGRSTVEAVARDPNGRWSAPRELDPTPVALQP